MTIACTSSMKEWVNKAPNCLEEETNLFKEFPGHNHSNTTNRLSWKLGTVPAGFTFKCCIWAADNLGDTIVCPHHDSLKLSELIPDVVRYVFLC